MFKVKNPLDYAIQKAKEIQNGKTDSGKTMQRVYALCLDKKNRLISEAGNSYIKTHPFQYECACSVGREKADKLHAEIAAIVKAKRKEIYKIVIARVGETGRPLPAHPCNICMEAIGLANIKSIEYSI